MLEEYSAAAYGRWGMELDVEPVALMEVLFGRENKQGMSLRTVPG